MRKIACAVLIAAASATTTLAAEAPAPGPASASFAINPAAGAVIGASLLSFFAFYLHPASKGDNKSGHKAYAGVVVMKCPCRGEELEITFEAGEAEYPYHDDALVISVRITDAWVQRVIVDTGSSVIVLYLNTFQKLGLTEKDLAPMASVLIGFTSDSISSLGMATLSITIREEPRSKTMMVTFMVFELPSAYNVILEHPTANKLRTTISTYHWTMKFPTRAGIREVRSDP
ncbi:hypothetical protein GW17_00039690 [Ensete ventricosum]|nr:hypothetical protein GW17_00039690 [Ensete ventricosum]